MSGFDFRSLFPPKKKFSAKKKKPIFFYRFRLKKASPKPGPRVDYKKPVFTKDHVITRYSKNLLISNYVHLGYKSFLLNNNFKKAILGDYSGVSIIKPELSLAALRLQTRFLSSCILTNQKVCVVAFDVPEFYCSQLNLGSQYYVINDWPYGLLTNFKVARKSLALKKQFFPFLPSALFVVSGLNTMKSYQVVREANRLLIPTFTTVDSIFNPSLFPYWLPSNTKSAYSKNFFLVYVQKLFLKLLLSKKSQFFSKMNFGLKKFKVKSRLDTLTQNHLYRKINYLKKRKHKNAKKL